MAFSKLEITFVKQKIDKFIKETTQPRNITAPAEITYYLKDQSVYLNLRQDDASKGKVESPIAKLSYVQTVDRWKMYHSCGTQVFYLYKTSPPTFILDEVLDELEADPHRKFWG